MKKIIKTSIALCTIFIFISGCAMKQSEMDQEGQTDSSQLKIPNDLNILNITTSSIEIQWGLAVSVNTSQDNLIYEIFISQNNLMDTPEDIRNNGTLVDTVTNLSGSDANYNITGLYESTNYYINTIVSDTWGNTDSYNMLKTATYSSSPVQMRENISQFNITWNFDKEYQCGQFANGDFWVVGPVTIVSITPASAEISGRTMNGSMINPVPGNRNQGYDSSCSGNIYIASLNVALNVSASNPLLVQNGSSLVSTISISAAGNSPQLQTAAILTVLSSAPPSGSFRPPYCGTDKTIKFNIDQLNYSLLKKLSPVANTPSLSTVERYFERPWLDHVSGWMGISIHPLDNMKSYGRNLCGDMGIGALMLHLNFTDEEKKTLLVRFVQLGIDNFGIIQNGGKNNWTADGGHMSGRKWPILFAGLVLDVPDMKKIGEKSGDHLYSGSYGPGNVPPDYIHFGEDDQTFYVSAEDVALSSVQTTNPNGCSGIFYGHYTPNDCRDFPEYETSDIGMPEWGILHATLPLYDGNIWSANYRACCTAVSWSGFVLAARIMGANTSTLWNHPSLFDYQDRYMAETAPAGPNPGYRAWDNFSENMWDTYRSSY